MKLRTSLKSDSARRSSAETGGAQRENSQRAILRANSRSGLRVSWNNGSMRSKVKNSAGISAPGSTGRSVSSWQMSG